MPHPEHNRCTQPSFLILPIPRHREIIPSMTMPVERILSRRRRKPLAVWEKWPLIYRSISLWTSLVITHVLSVLIPPPYVMLTSRLISTNRVIKRLVPLAVVPLSRRRTIIDNVQLIEPFHSDNSLSHRSKRTQTIINRNKVTIRIILRRIFVGRHRWSTPMPVYKTIWKLSRSMNPWVSIIDRWQHAQNQRRDWNEPMSFISIRRTHSSLLQQQKLMKSIVRLAEPRLANPRKNAFRIYWRLFDRRISPVRMVHRTCQSMIYPHQPWIPPIRRPTESDVRYAALVLKDR